MRKFNPSIFIFFIFLILLISLAFSNPPEVHKVFKYHPIVEENVSFAGFSLKEAFFLLVNYLVITIFGYAISHTFFADLKNVLILIKLVASFFVGFISCLGIIRLLSLVFSYTDIYRPTIISVLIITVLLLKNQMRWQGVSYFKNVINLRTFTTFLSFFTGVTVFISVVLMLQIHQGEFAWVGHGPEQYAHIFQMERKDVFTHFPIILQHYDEMIFHYFLTSPFKSEFNPILAWWITLALTKLSLCMFLYLVFKKMNIASWFSWIACLYLMMGTTSLIPTKYYMLFDASNPLYFTVHAGRIIGIGLVLMMMMDYSVQEKRDTCLSRICFCLLGLGLAATSISNVAWIVIIFMLLVVFSSYHHHQRPSENFGVK